MAIPNKERLLVSKIRDFIEKNNSIALIAGIRKTGKTTILDQLENSYKENMKVLRIDCTEEQDDCAVLNRNRYRSYFKFSIVVRISNY